MRFPPKLAVLWAVALCCLGIPCRPVPADDIPASRTGAPVTFLQINDVYTAAPVDGGKAGGLARVASLAKQFKAEGRTTVMVLPGDFLSPSVASGIFQGKQMVDALNATGLDIATLGNHEFDFGVDVLRQRMKEAKWQWVVSNALDEATGNPLGDAAPYLIRRYGPLNVGYIGLCLTGEEISRDKLIGAKLLDPFETTARLLPVLKEKGADVIVAITHQDYADDRRLAERFPDIDLILGGHEHFPITAMVNRALISKAGSDARFVARLDLNRITPQAPLEKHFELIPITDALPDDPETARVVADYEAKLSKELDVAAGTTRTPLNAVAESVRAGESNLGNLLADAMKANVGADLAILNAGSIRSNRVFPAGSITRRDVLAIHPFGGVVVKVEVSGATVLAALNHGVGRLGESVGRFPQVSGVTFDVDPNAPAGDRVRNARVNGQPLDPQRTYTVAIGDYMLKGGDGYNMFVGSTVLVDPAHGALLITALEDLIRQKGEVAPTVEGRVRIARAVTPATTKRPVILDTDMGIDSVLGMLYLLKAPEVSLRAVTIANGIADVKAGAENALRILELTGHRDIPVASGPPQPLQGARSFPSFWREQANTLGGAKLPAAVAKLRPESAEDLIIAELEKSAEPVTIVTMGPLTNVALALKKKPDVARKIAEIIVMGGAVAVAGNVDKPFVGIKNSVAEWNFYIDPHAVQQVFASGVPIRLLPLDASRSLPITPAFVDRVRKAPRDATSDLLLALLDAVNDGIEGGWYFFWDTLAAVATAHPEVMGSHEAQLEVVTEEGPTLGQVKPATQGGARVRIGEEVNREAFEEHYLKSVLG
ncbi:MAG: nucleoside hydrolase [Armatimonadota bacterium]|nr:nucleoside hydrolase [Armatimonadota bacterium]